MKFFETAKTLEIFLIFLRLGLTSFGGPIAHLGYFHDEFVKKRNWISEHAYADLVALCQFLPGPASSQVGMAIGLTRAGLSGAMAAWLGFTLPSALLLVFFAMGISAFNFENNSALHGLKIVAVAIVAQALWGMGKNLYPDKRRLTMAALAAFIILQFNNAYIQIGVIALSGVLGWLFLKKSKELPHAPIQYNISKKMGSIFLVIFFLILGIVPFLAQTSDSNSLKLFDSFFRAGSLVFGGGHVVLPLLQAEVVPNNWVSNNMFMAGYGAAQAIPGPLFSFSAYLGAVTIMAPSMWMGAILCLVAAFLPAFLLIVGALPFWEQFRQYENVKYAMQGINASVVGLLLAALYNPVWTSAIYNIKDFALAGFCFLLLMLWKVPSWLIVLISASLAGFFL